MTLLAVRTKAVDLSGRYDLVVNTTSYVDAGMNFFITAGQKYLDKLAQVPENTAQVFEALASGEYSVTFQNSCRSIDRVFVNSSSERYELEKVNLSDLKNAYTELASATTTDAPAFYAIANLRALETTAKTSLVTFINLTWTETDEKYDYRGIIIVPPADEDYVVEISGKFRQNDLSSDTDENYWTTEYPHLLVMATLRAIEVFNRNTEGIKDWTAAIAMETSQLDLDAAEEESNGVTQMVG